MWSGPTLTVKLWPYQREVYWKALKEEKFGLWLDQGTGKTVIALRIITRLWSKGKINHVLILAPKSVLSIWEDEIATKVLVPVAFTDNPMKPVINEGKLTFCLCNYESLKRYVKKARRLKSGYDLCIADESHRIKERSSINSRATWFLSRNSRYRYALSGTPMGNSEIDFYAQYRYIDYNIFGDYKKFDQEYFKPCGYMGYDRKLRKIKKDKFYELVHRYSCRVTKDECLDLPPLLEVPVRIGLDKSVTKMYEKLEKELLLEFVNKEGDSKTVTTTLPVVLLTKLQQLCCGFLYDDEGEVIPLKIKNPKIEYLQNILDGNTGKVVVFCKFTHEIDLIAKSIKGRKILTYDGRTEDKSIWKEFARTDKYDLMVAHIKSGGTGLNLQTANTLVFFSLPYSYIDYSQAKDRVYRAGQEKKVTVYYLLARDTIEEDILKVVKTKHSTAEEILDYARRRLG